MRLIATAAVLIGVALTTSAASADEPGPIRRAPPARVVIENYVQEPVLLPECVEAFHAKLLQCQPRVAVRPPYGPEVLNQIHGMPVAVRKPYPFLFSW